MRFIPLHENMPPQKWLDLAARAEAEIEIEAKNGREARNIKIDKKAKVWGALKPWLLQLSYGKCWFSEARECFEDWDVEHYRPKKNAKDLDGNDRDGYWWLSFDWKNYRISGRRTNSKKGTFFPVHNFPADEAHRSHVDDELPYLLDPCNEHDCELLSFDSLGRAVPMSGVEGWESERVKFSIKIYKLDFDNLELARQLVWNTCDQAKNEIQNLMKEYNEKPTVTLREKINEKMAQFTSYASKEREFSSVALAYMAKSDAEWARKLPARITNMGV
jgi:hypothetical protein